MVGVDADEIVFTSGATESNNLALLGLGRRAAGGKRRRILLSAIEHKCVLAAGRVLEYQYGFTIDTIPVDGEGLVDLPALEVLLDDDVLVVSVMAVNNEIGAIQNTAAISRLARHYGALFHSDAAQAPVATNLEGIGKHADFISLSAHKMYGPKGIGVAVIPRQLQGQVEPLVYGGDQQNGLRSGTVPVPLCVGMGASAELLAADDAEELRAALRRRTDTFIEKLQGLPWPISTNGPSGYARHPGNASICFAGFAAHDVLTALQPRLAASTGSACTSGIPEPSHVLRAIGLNSDEAESSIRFSLGFGTSDEDIDEAVDLIKGVLERLCKSELVRLA